MKILIFGGSSGIGKAVVLRAAREGHSLLICARDEKKLQSAADEANFLRSGAARCKHVDLADIKNLGNKLDEIVQDFGVPSGILLNGGGPPFSTFAELSLQTWTQYFDQMVMANVMILKNFLPLMAAPSSIVCVLSDVIRNAGPGKTLPCSLRMALLGIIKCLSFEYAEKGIRFNAISPGSVDTERAATLLKKSADLQGIEIKEFRHRFTSALPMKRMGTPEEIAEIAYFLLSENSSYVNGTNVICDGGTTVMPV